MRPARRTHARNRLHSLARRWRPWLEPDVVDVVAEPTRPVEKLVAEPTVLPDRATLGPADETEPPA